MNGPMTDLWQVLLILINGPMAGAANTNKWAHYVTDAWGHDSEQTLYRCL